MSPSNDSRFPRMSLVSPLSFLGFGLLGAAILANPWTLIATLSPDGELAWLTFGLVLAGDSILVLAGLAILRFRSKITAASARWLLANYPNFSALLLSVVLMAGLFIAVELLFYGINARQGRPADIWRQARTEDRSGLVRDVSPGLRERDPLLGHRTRANSLLTERLTKDGRVIFEATYTINEHGLREAPHPAGGPRDRFILFFGDSFAFGTGVNDNQSSAAVVAAASRYRVYNFANPGYGPHHTLAILREWDLRGIVHESDGVAVHVFIPQQASRTIGTMLHVTSYGRHDPAFRARADGTIEFEGSFASGRPLRTALYDRLVHEQVLRWLGRDWPPAVLDRHLRTTARVLAGAAEMFRESFGSDEFYVLLHPLYEPSGIRPERIREVFADSGLKVLDYSTLFQDGASGLFYPFDFHPTPEGHRRIGARLVDDLGLRGPSG